MSSFSRALFVGLVTLAISWPGGGVSERVEDECRCESASADASSAHEDAETAHETCPPDCDGCSCCGAVTAIAAASSPWTTVVPVRPAPRSFSMESDAPPGTRAGVFRPPRA
ncbi:MAG: hypothetical protein VYE22_30210 [Myxococcota bacterium]|nr:hypothetical protein [Myxococcota bacterium]